MCDIYTIHLYLLDTYILSVLLLVVLLLYSDMYNTLFLLWELS